MRIRERDEKKKEMRRLIHVLTEYESKSKSVEAGLESEAVSCDPLELLPSNGHSDEVEVYRQFIVERINSGYITIAFKLYCIGYYIPFCREIINSNRPISNAQTIRDMFDEMLKKESCEGEKSKFLSICDKWYTALEPENMMNDLQKELLRKWIMDGGYTNMKDSVVSMVIRKITRSGRKYLRGRRRMKTKKWRNIIMKDYERWIRERDEKKEEMRRLTNVLTEYESKSKSVEAGLESEAMSRDPFASLPSNGRSDEAEVYRQSVEAGLESKAVSCDPLKLLPSNGRSDEEKVYSQLIVERINDGDNITTAFKLYCIGHYMPFCREIINDNRPISDDQTIKNMFDVMLQIESYEEEESKFLSILDTWHELLEPEDCWDTIRIKIGMNDLKEELLRKWITDKGYTNIEDSVVSMVIRKCVMPQTDAEVKEGKEMKKCIYARI